MSGHLLLGLSRIFARKVQYLYHDSSEAFAHMKSVSAGAPSLFATTTSTRIPRVSRVPAQRSTSTRRRAVAAGPTLTCQRGAQRPLLPSSSCSTTRSRTRSCSSACTGARDLPRRLLRHPPSLRDDCCSFDFGGDGGAIPLVGDMADWVAFGTQQGGSQQGAPGSASRSAQRLDRSLRMGRGYAREWKL